MPGRDTRRSTSRPAAPQPPAPPPHAADLPAPLTIFLTRAEREQILRKLGRRHRDRRAALLAALKIAPAPASQQDARDQPAKRKDARA